VTLRDRAGMLAARAGAGAAVLGENLHMDVILMLCNINRFFLPFKSQMDNILNQLWRSILHEMWRQT